MDGAIRKVIDVVKKFVVSNTLQRVDWNAELIRGAELERKVREPKQQPGKGLLTGVTLPLALAELGLIDQYDFLIHPRIAGRGPSLLAGLEVRRPQAGRPNSVRALWPCSTSPSAMEPPRLPLQHRRAIPSRCSTSTPIAGRYVRIVAVIALLLGLSDARRCWGGVGTTTESRWWSSGSGGFVYLAIFCLARLFAAVGLWIQVSWGGDPAGKRRAALELGMYLLRTPNVQLERAWLCRAVGAAGVDQPDLYPEASVQQGTGAGLTASPA